MTAKEWMARAVAFDECAEHLLQDWTEDEIEKEQSEKLCVFLRKKALTCHRKAVQLDPNIELP